MFQPAASPAFKTHWPSGTSNECPLGVKVTLNGIASLPSLQCALVASSHGIDDRVRDQLAVEHRDLLAELEAPRVAHEPVEVAPAVEDLGRLVLPRSDHEVVRLRGDRVGVDPDDLQAAHEMTLVVRLVEQRLRDAVDAVLEHALALERERAERELAVEVLARLQLVDALFGEELGPLLVAPLIEAGRVARVEVLDLQAKRDVEPGVAFHGYSPMTSR